MSRKCAVMVCNDSNVEKVDLKWKWVNEKLRRVDQYKYLGVGFPKECR